MKCGVGVRGKLLRSATIVDRNLPAPEINERRHEKPPDSSDSTHRRGWPGDGCGNGSVAVSLLLVSASAPEPTSEGWLPSFARQPPRYGLRIRQLLCVQDE